MKTSISPIYNPARFGVVNPTLQIGFGRKIRFICVALIVRIEGSGNYSWLYGRNGERYLVAKTLYALHKELPDFWRVHKSRLINPKYIAGSAWLVQNKSLLRLSTGENVVVARRHKKEVYSYLRLSLNA